MTRPKRVTGEATVEPSAPTLPFLSPPTGRRYTIARLGMGRKFDPYEDVGAERAAVHDVIVGLCPEYNAPEFEGAGVYDHQPTTAGVAPTRRRPAPGASIDVVTELVAAIGRLTVKLERVVRQWGQPRPSKPLQRVIERRYAELLDYAKKRVGKDAALDVVQDAITDLAERGYTLEGRRIQHFIGDDDAFRVLFATVKNRARRHEKKQRRALMYEQPLPLMEPPEDGEEAETVDAYAERDGVDGETQGRARFAPQAQVRRGDYGDALAAKVDVRRAIETEGVDWLEGLWLASIAPRGVNRFWLGLTRESFRAYCDERYGTWGARAYESLRWRCDRLRASLRKRLKDWTPVERGSSTPPAPRCWPRRPSLFDRTRRDTREQFVARMSGISERKVSAEPPE